MTLSFDLSDPPLADVVLVNPETVNEWEYPPYSGHYDGMLPFKCCSIITMMYSRRKHLGSWQH